MNLSNCACLVVKYSILKLKLLIRGDFMSWKETYNAWKNYQALEPDLKDELAKLEGNDEALEDAFYAPM